MQEKGVPMLLEDNVWSNQKSNQKYKQQYEHNKITYSFFVTFAILQDNLTEIRQRFSAKWFLKITFGHNFGEVHKYCDEFFTILQMSEIGCVGYS